MKKKEEPSRTEQLQFLMHLHSAALKQDLDTLKQEAPEKLLETVRERPIESMAAVAGASFLLSQVIAYTRRRKRRCNPGNGHPFLTKMAKVMITRLIGNHIEV